MSVTGTLAPFNELVFEGCITFAVIIVRLPLPAGEFFKFVP